MAYCVILQCSNVAHPISFYKEFVSVTCGSSINVMVTVSRISSAVLWPATSSNWILMVWGVIASKPSSRYNTQKGWIRFECLRWIMEHNHRTLLTIVSNRWRLQRLQGEHFCPSILIDDFRSISVHKYIWLNILTAMKC